MPDPNAHCSYCGARWPAGAAWPRTCSACAATSWLNPIPVGVLVVPVRTRRGTLGVLAVRRAIEPGRGSWALPGGFLVQGESWQAGAAREVLEETGIRLDPDGVSLLRVQSTPDGARLLVFGRVPEIGEERLAAFEAGEEVDELRVLEAPETLAFSLHTAVLAELFAAGDLG